jgi:hypothetical protein
MALWGNQDNLTGPTPVEIVGTASSEFWTMEGADFVAAGIETGFTAILGTEGDGGFATIESFITPTLARVGKMSAVAAGAGQVAVYCNQPISLKNDPGYAESSADGSLGRTQRPVGVSTAEIIAGAATTNFGGIHAGWVGVTTYVDGDGNYRVKSETFVASSSVQTGNRPFPS